MVLSRIFQTRFELEVLQLGPRKMGQLNTFSEEDEMCANHFDAKALELCLISRIIFFGHRMKI